MGEGWGDFFAVCMTSQATDDFAKGMFAVGGWTDLTPTFKDNYYFSHPPLSLFGGHDQESADVQAHQRQCRRCPPGRRESERRAAEQEVHNAGEVWCCTLWEVFVNLVAAHGHAAAEPRMLRYVIGGLKLTPSNPTFLQARDAIISAATRTRSPPTFR